LQPCNSIRVPVEDMGLGLVKLEALLRELTATGDVMTYCEAAKKIGLLGG
jgi:hypothetical protein